MRWVFNTQRISSDLKDFAKSLGLDDTIVELLSQISFASKDELRRFLEPSLRDVEPPENICHLSEAVQQLNAACHQQKKIAVLSDYDVDGITSMALMWHFFHALNFKFTAFFPNREIEGYGLTERVVDRILANGESFDLFVACDCGTNSGEAVMKLKDHGIAVIIIDHHQHTQAILPEAIIINPHVYESLHSPSAKELCSVGLVFKLIHAWLKLLKKENYPSAIDLRLRPFLDLVALGTIADMVPLLHENRLWVFFGLQEIIRTKIIGLQKLLMVSDCNLNFPVSVEDVSFKLAPRINASGRLQTADMTFKLFTSTDAATCEYLAQQLNDLNQERQAIEKQIVQEAEALLEADPNQPAYVLYKPSWHIGVVGIVAGRLTRKYNCPVFVLGEHEGKAKGSGRSIPDVNLVEMFTAANELIYQWGGHPAAVGLTIFPENVAPLEQCFRSYLNKKFPQGLPEAILPIAAAITLPQITSKFIQAIDKLAPFGQGHETPIFVIKNMPFPYPPERFGKDNAHIRFKLGEHTVIGWNFGKNNLPLRSPVDLAVKFTWTYWQNERKAQVLLVDWHHTEV